MTLNTVAEDAGGALHKGFLPSLNLPGVDLIPGPRLLAPHRLQSHLGLESEAMRWTPFLNIHRASRHRAFMSCHPALFSQTVG